MRTEGKHTAEFLLSEGNGSISRDVVTLNKSSGDLEPGTVLGKVTVGGKYVPYDAEAEDGSQTAVAVLYAAAADSSSDQEVVVIARDAEVLRSSLTGIDTAGEAGLKAQGIIVRDAL